jgi:hypothetical protein
MQALLITLLITVPIIAVGTLLYLWRNRGRTTSDRRWRGALIGIVFFAAVGGLSVLRWSSEPDGLGRYSLVLLSLFIILASLVGELVRASRRR